MTDSPAAPGLVPAPGTSRVGPAASETIEQPTDRDSVKDELIRSLQLQLLKVQRELAAARGSSVSDEHSDKEKGRLAGEGVVGMMDNGASASAASEHNSRVSTFHAVAFEDQGVDRTRLSLDPWQGGEELGELIASIKAETRSMKRTKQAQKEADRLLKQVHSHCILAQHPAPLP